MSGPCLTAQPRLSSQASAASSTSDSAKDRLSRLYNAHLTQETGWRFLIAEVSVGVRKRQTLLSPRNCDKAVPTLFPHIVGSISLLPGVVAGELVLHKPDEKDMPKLHALRSSDG